MGLKLHAILLFILTIMLVFGAGCTDTGRFAVSGKASTLGLGGEFITAVAPDINARVGINALDVDFSDKEIENIEYDLGIDFSSFSALVDWHAFDDSFRFSGGVISLENKVDLESSPTENIKIGDEYYTPAEVGTLFGRVESDKVAPYVGIGWGNPFTSNKRWGFTCDLGVAFTGSPDVSLDAEGGTNPPGLDEELEKEKNDIEDFFDKFKVYPVIAINFFYRF